MVASSLTELDDDSLDEAAALVAREHDAARAVRPLLPSAWSEVPHSRVALARLMADGYTGAVARLGGRCVGLMCGRANGETAFLPAAGVAVDPDLDPTPVVAGLFAALAPVLLETGALRHLINHVALAPLSEAFSNLGFGRASVFGTQPSQPFAAHPDIEVRTGDEADLDVIADLSHVELLHRSTPPVYAPPLPNTLADTRARHRRLMDAGAVHLLARLDGEDVGLLTLETTSPAPRLCADGRPYIGPTATAAPAHGRGVGTALVRAALDWAHRHDQPAVSVDFDSPNPLSRPFWTGMGFETTGYGVRRTLPDTFSGTRPPDAVP